MKQIKFSHPYVKLAGIPKLARLLHVQEINLEDLSEDFLDYDTSYYEKGNLKHYSLPARGKFLLLLFKSLDSHAIFTTIRNRYGKLGDKKDYYTDSIGHIFEVVKYG